MEELVHIWILQQLLLYQQLAPPYHLTGHTCKASHNIKNDEREIRLKT